MPTTLITGANRGLGLEYARQYAALGWDVIACTRQPQAETLRSLDAARVKIFQLDVTDHSAVDALAAELRGTAVDVLVNNAGTTGPKGAPECMEYSGVDNTDYEIWRQVLEVNLLGAFKIATAFRPHLTLAERGILVNMSSDLGSLHAMGDPESDQYGVYAAGYQSSKCALNVLTRLLANELADTGIKVNSASPGVSRTDMGGADAPLSVEQGAATAVWLATLDNDGPSGEFFSASLNGARHPW